MRFKQHLCSYFKKISKSFSRHISFKIPNKFFVNFRNTMISKKIIRNIHNIKSELSLKKQMMFVFISISIIPLILMGTFIFSKVYGQMSKSQKNMLEAHSEGVKNNINTTIGGSYNILKSLSSQSDLLVLMEDVHKSKEIIEAVKLNKVIISMENAIESSEKLYETIFIADLNGKIIADGSKYHQKYAKFNISDTDYYNKIKSGEKFYVGEPIKSIATNNYVIPVAASIESKADKMGIMVIMFDLSKFTTSMENIKIGDSGFLYIVSKSGNIVYHKNKDKLLFKAENKLVDDELKNLNGDNTIKGFKFYSEEGKESVAAYNGIESTNWLVVTSMSKSEFMRSITEVGLSMFFIVVIMIIICVFVSLKYSNAVTEPINSIGILMKEVSEGNINVKADYNTSVEVKQLCRDFNEMTGNLRELISKIVNVSNSVTTASNNFVNLTSKAFESSKLVSSSIEQIAYGTQEQAVDVEKGANQIENIANNIAQITENADVMMEAAVTTDEIVGDGLKEMQSLNIKALESYKASEEVYNEVTELTCSVKEIEEIIAVISNIANQTNLLALNAAIEAAHAGELGKGFSVVAEEVKKLSQISSQKTQEITQIIRKLEIKAKNVQRAVNENKTIVSEQNIVVQKTEDALNNIYFQVNKVKNIISVMSNKVGIINGEKNIMIDVVNNIAMVANETAANSETASGAAVEQFSTMKEIKENSQDLNKLSIDLINSLYVFTKAI